MKERLPTKARNLNRLARTGLTIGAMVLGGSVLSGCSSTTPEKAQENATARYDQAFNSASPAGKFLIQYLRKTQISEVQDQGLADISYCQFTFGKACLQGTAYDISGGSVTASSGSSGIFSYSSSSASANVPTAAAFAELDPKDSDKLLVRSGHDNSVDLHFINVGGPGRLEPADSATKNIAKTYGCETDQYIAYEPDVPGGFEKTSEYIK